MARKKTSDGGVAVLDNSSMFADMAKATGGEVVGKMQRCRYYVDTGSLALNRICSGRYITGGIPGGRLTEIYGPSSSSKSLVGSNILFGTQKMNGWPVKLDTENADNPEFMQSASHLDIDKVLRYTPITLEECFGKIYNVVKKIRERVKIETPITVVYDSISVSPSAREFRETELGENPTEAEWKKVVGAKEQPGERARICSREFRKLTPLLEENNTTLVIMNQTREKIGVLYGSPETTAGGGNALPFYASCRLRTQTQKKIEHEKLEKAIGVNVKIKNVKNRSCPPFCESEGIQLLFANGINPVSGLLSLLIQDERVELVGAGRYLVKAQFASEADYTFQASKARNDVPVKLLIDNPKLIDASSSEEVEEYLKPFMSALAVCLSEGVVEKKVMSEEMDVDESYDRAGEKDE